MKRTRRRQSSSSSSNESIKRTHKRKLRSRSQLSSERSIHGSSETDSIKPLKVYIVQAKLNGETIQELYELVDLAQDRHSGDSQEDGEHGLELELCNAPNDADVIITNIRTRKRLERHVNWNVARQKAIVTPDWLRDCVKQNAPIECGNYAALSELHDETVNHCPEKLEVQSHNAPSDSSTSYELSSSEITSIKPTVQRIFGNWRSRYACTRASPLVCTNQRLAEELWIIGRSRELEGQSINALSYERSVAIIKSYPHRITEEIYKKDIIKLPGLGDKTLSKIMEFIENGYIQESETIRTSDRFQSLSLFTSIYGIGPVNARKLYDIGLRTIEDLERYYDVPLGSNVEYIEDELLTPNGQKITLKGKPPELSIKVALTLREDLDVLITKDEVEEMNRVVMKELCKLQPGCVSTIVGGYRRGKQKSNDVDIVISHSNLNNGTEIMKGIGKRFAKHLYTQGLVTHVLHPSGFHTHDPHRLGHRNSLEKVLTVFVLPADSTGRKQLHRRLDLIFAAPEAYWTAVVGWSGSKMFERDLRLWAKNEKGLKFDSSGLTRRHDSKLYVPRSEQEVFDILGLDWIDPTMRNADV